MKNKGWKKNIILWGGIYFLGISSSYLFQMHSESSVTVEADDQGGASIPPAREYTILEKQINRQDLENINHQLSITLKEKTRENESLKTRLEKTAQKLDRIKAIYKEYHDASMLRKLFSLDSNYLISKDVGEFLDIKEEQVKKFNNLTTDYVKKLEELDRTNLVEISKENNELEIHLPKIENIESIKAKYSTAIQNVISSENLSYFRPKLNSLEAFHSNDRYLIIKNFEELESGYDFSIELQMVDEFGNRRPYTRSKGKIPENLRYLLTYE